MRTLLRSQQAVPCTWRTRSFTPSWIKTSRRLLTYAASVLLLGTMLCPCHRTIHSLLKGFNPQPYAMGVLLAWVGPPIVSAAYRIFKMTIIWAVARAWGFVCGAAGQERMFESIGVAEPEEIGADADGIYGLEHVALNWCWDKGLRSMWMNMGYWQNTTCFPVACENLLIYLLECAEILPSSKCPKPRDLSLSILDLGFGCGDQTIFLSTRLPSNVTLTSYVGITLSKIQCRFAKKRVLEGRDVIDVLLDGAATFPPKHAPGRIGLGVENKLKTLNATSTHEDDDHNAGMRGKISLYNADASNPQSWPSSLHLSLLPPLSPPTSPFTPSQSPSLGFTPHSASAVFGNYLSPSLVGPHEHWTLALDSLYHFRPSRVPLLRYTHGKLRSNLLAFDLFRPEDPYPPASNPTTILPRNFYRRLAYLLRSLFLRLFCLAASIPYSNLLTREQYISMLTDKVGYRRDNIVIVDISHMVFPGLAAFIERRTKEMGCVGMRWKWWAGFKVVGWVVGSGIVQGGVVVARYKEAEL
ncbi:hypothetical protein BDZ91DRAFT_719145 [Kalaharituber pfeilii]|nr:hypothetical protein BDZ91DRAFT_719145 [Kalaharituber pfeilii]